MSRPRRAIDCPREPIALSAPEAAAYLGVSETAFREAVEKGIFPKARTLLGRVLWDADELRAAFRGLPRQGEAPKVDGAPDWGRPAA